jgi:hypothetical protein
MRITIREQFSLLVLLVSLNALMVLALAVVRLSSPANMAELLLMQCSGSKVTTSSWVSGKIPWIGGLCRGHALILSQTIRPDLDGLAESSRAICNTFTVPVAGAIHLNTHPPSVRSRRME